MSDEWWTRPSDNEGGQAPDEWWTRPADEPEPEEPPPEEGRIRSPEGMMSVLEAIQPPEPEPEEEPGPWTPEKITGRFQEPWRPRSSDFVNDPVSVVRNSRQYHDLITTMTLLWQSHSDPSVGNPMDLEDRVNIITEHLVRDAEISRAALDRLVEHDMGVIRSEGAAGRVGQFAMNAFGATMGAFEPLLAAGDFTRTFTWELADIQEERMARQAQEAGEEWDLAPGTFRGEPAENPFTAAKEMALATHRALNRMGFTESPWVWESDEKVGPQLNPESGWLAYAPSLGWGEHRVGVTPYEAGLAPTGREIVERWDLGQRFGVEGEMGLEALGLAMEVMMDPWLGADVLFGLSRAFGTAGRLRAAASKVETNAMIGVANQLESLATTTYRAISPYGFARAAAGRARDLESLRLMPRGITDGFINFMSRTVNNFLDRPAPTVFTRPGAGTARGTGMFQNIDLVTPLWRDVLFQGGVPAWLPRPAGRPEFLAGSPSYGQGIAQVARGQERLVQEIAFRGIKDMRQAITTGLMETQGVQIPVLRFWLPNSQVVKKQHQGYVNGLSAILTDFLDNVGPVAMARGIPNEYVDRLTALSRLHGHDQARTFARFKEAATHAQTTMARIGYEISGYGEYARAMQRAADNMGLDYGDIRRAYEQHVGGIDIQHLEQQQFFPGQPPGSVPSTARTQASVLSADDLARQLEADPELVSAWQRAVREELEKAGRADLANITPEQFLASQRDGHLRREFYGVEAPTEAIGALKRRDLVMVYDMDSADFAGRLSNTFGEEVFDAMVDYYNIAYPQMPKNVRAVLASGDVDAIKALGDMSPAFTANANDIAEILSRRLNTDVTPKMVADVIYQDDASYRMMQETVSLLSERSGPGVGAGGVYAMTPAPFQERQTLTPAQIASLVQITDPTQVLASSALAGGRARRASSFLGDAYDGFKAEGLLLTKDEVVRNVAAGGSSRSSWETLASKMDRHEAGEQADAFLRFTHPDLGAEFVIVPHNRSTWGPLAGHAIPADAARMVVYTQQFARQTDEPIQRILSMWRRGLLAPFSTSLRNVVGNFFLMQQAGANVTDMLQSLPEAHRIWNHYQGTGQLPDLFRGYEPQFSFLHNTTMSTHVRRDVGDQLARLVNVGSEPTSILRALDDATEIMTGQARYGGFLGMFKWGEEVTRTSAFLSSYRGLTRQGVAHAEAVTRAAHFAQNAGYNYGALPLLPEFLRHWGLSAFPQFTYFTIGRTARVAVERPAVPTRWEYVRRSLGLASFEGDLEEQERVTAMSAGWLRYSQPFAVPIPQEDGSYYVINLDYWYPQGADPMDMLVEPFQGGVYTPVIDAVYAWAWGDGQGAFGTRFGQEVYDPTKTTAGKVADTAFFLSSQYILPGLTRNALQIADAFKYNRNKEELDLLGIAHGRYHNSDWMQLFGRLVGLSSQKVDVTGMVSYRQRRAAIDRQYQRSLTRLGQDLEVAVMTGDDSVNELMDQIVRLQRERAAAHAELARHIR